MLTSRSLIMIVVIAAAAASCSTNRPTETLSGAPVALPSDVSDPTDDQILPLGYVLDLERDRLKPVYRPEFTSADGVSWANDELVIGVVIDNDARAYPVSFLYRREIVNDIHRGIPTLVTW